MKPIKNIYIIFAIISLFSNVLLFSQIRVGYGLSSDYTMSVLGTDVDVETEGGITLGYDYALQNKEDINNIEYEETVTDSRGKKINWLKEFFTNLNPNPYGKKK